AGAKPNAKASTARNTTNFSGAVPAPEASTASKTANFSGAAPTSSVVGPIRVAAPSTNRVPYCGCGGRCMERVVAQSSASKRDPEEFLVQRSALSGSYAVNGAKAKTRRHRWFTDS